MSTTQLLSSRTDGVEILSNEDDETLTYVADLEEDSLVPPTEWITVDSEDTVDVVANR
jgi:hypothetical protein